MKKICIVSPNYKAYSETFIQNHIDQLPCEKTVVYALGNDAHFDDGNTLLRMDKLSRFIRFFERLITKINIVEQEVKHLMKLLKKQNINCVLAEYGITGAILVKACKQNGISLVVHFHGYDAYQKALLQEYQALYAEMFDYAKAIIAVSSDMKKQLVGLGATQEKVKYIPYGIDLNKFKPKNNIQTSSYFLAVGRFVEKKAPYLTVLAFSKVVAQLPGAKLVMAGTGPLWEVCKQLVRSLGIEEAVDFKGAISNEEVSSLMYGAFCLVQHSITPESGDSEGTPLAVLEASASGLPVVSTRHAGIKDAILHGESGYLVEEGNVQQMAHYMIKLYKEPELADQLGKKGREWISKQYSLDKRIKNLWQILNT